MDKSDDEFMISDEIHKKFLERVKQIHGKPKITPATRTEATSEISEFNLQSKKKSKTGKTNFREADLINAIKKKKPSIAQKLNSAKKSRTLPKPLDTVFERRAQREVGFQNVKSQLNRWNDVVSNNRVSDQLHFPLKNKKIEIYDHTESNLFSSFETLTPLEKEFSKLLDSSETSKEEQKKLEQSKFRLNMKEMIEKRKAFAKMKAQASYQMTKTRRQNRIKSKKYHRILRKEKVKQQVKDFESLQKTDPAAALKQLESLEKSRAQERATLRHRNTGKWARNQLIKAKYDKESRQAISEQLSKNRELTEKKYADNMDSDSSDSDGENLLNDTSVPVTDPSNPWLASTDDYAKFISDYKKHWKETNMNAEDESASREEALKVTDPTEETETCEKDIANESEATEKTETPSGDKTGRKKRRKKTPKKSSTCPTKMIKTIENSSGRWTVTSIQKEDKSNLSDGESKIIEMFDSLNRKLEQKIRGKFKEIQMEEKSPVKTSDKVSERVSKKRKKKNSANKFTVIENAEENKKIEEKKKTEEKRKLEERKSEPVETALDTGIPDLMAAANDELDDDEDDAELQYKMTISEAFVDDDVVAEFQEEKKKTEEADKPQLIDTSLPGWGSWTDASSMREKETKKARHRRIPKRLLFKIPKAPPRKDANKGFVIMKEGMHEKFKEHMVSELPYPFNKVEDFEAHIRAPIGRTWLPETAHQKIIAPPIVTKLGTVIEPIDEGELIERENIEKKTV